MTRGEQPAQSASPSSDGAPSKSQRKREHRDIQALVRRLHSLPPAQLAQLPLTAATREAIAAASGLSRGALKRQLKFAAGLLAGDDPPAVAAALDNLERPARVEVRAFHQVESWRERLIEGEQGVMEEIRVAVGEIDDKVIAQLAREAREQATAGRPPRAARALFRYLARITRDEPG